jgi:hypothetical protein
LGSIVPQVGRVSMSACDFGFGSTVRTPAITDIIETRRIPTSVCTHLSRNAQNLIKLADAAPACDGKAQSMPKCRRLSSLHFHYLSVFG